VTLPALFVRDEIDLVINDFGEELGIALRREWNRASLSGKSREQLVSLARNRKDKVVM
jgi:hypothetical protein